MKKLKTAITLLICLLYSFINAQDKETEFKEIATFEIRDGRENGTDITPQIIENNARLVLFKDNSIDEIILSNYWEKVDSQSFGRIYAITKEESIEGESIYKCKIYQFSWSYINTYDKKEGTAKVELFLIYKPQGIYYEITIIPENLDVMVYKGVMTGDLTELDSNIKK